MLFKIVSALFSGCTTTSRFEQAVREGDHYKVQSLLQKKPKLASTRFDDDGSLPIFKAGNLLTLKALVDHGVTPYEGQLHCVFYHCMDGRADIVNHFISRKNFDVNTPGLALNSTLLMVACRNSHIEVVNLLLESGADICLKDDEGKTAFDYLDHEGINAHRYSDGDIFRLERAKICKKLLLLHQNPDEGR